MPDWKRVIGDIAKSVAAAAQKSQTTQQGRVVARSSATAQHGIDHTLKAFATQVMPAVSRQIG